MFRTSDGRLFQLAQTGRGIPSIAATLFWTVATLAIMIVSQVGARAVLRSLLGDSVAIDPLAELLGFFSIFVVLWILLHFWRQREFSSLGFGRQAWTTQTARGALIAVVSMMAITGALVLSGAVISSGYWHTRGVGGLALGVVTFLATTVQSTSEEALFRGWLLPALGIRTGLVAGIVLSSLAFTIAHATTGPPPLGWINLFLFGCFATLLAVNEGGLWAASAWHAVWNWTEGGLLGFSVDRSIRTGLLASIHATGPDYVSGGTFGPEGGLVVTGVLVASVIGLLSKTTAIRRR
jgi:membrane protease YdiL (CAAX protease family)